MFIPRRIFGKLPENPIYRPPFVNGAAHYVIANTPFGGFERMGVDSRALVITVNSEEEALKYVQKAPKHCQFAPKRVGVVYEKSAIHLNNN
jgi:hypothetical protein